MLIQTSFVGEGFVAIITFEWIFSCMYLFNMPNKISFIRKTFITNIAFEGKTLVNWFNMTIQVCFLRKTSIANVASKWLASFMNWFDMVFKFPFSEKALSQSLHFNGFFTSWTEPTWFDLQKAELHFRSQAIVPQIPSRLTQ